MRAMRAMRAMRGDRSGVRMGFMGSHTKGHGAGGSSGAAGESHGGTGHDKRYGGGVEKLRRAERLEMLELGRVVELCLEGGACRSVLDVGTGSGLFAEAFLRRGLAAVGCDVSEEMLEAARRLVPGAAFVSGAMERLPFEDGSFDLLFLGHVLHEAYDVDRALGEARRVARVRVAILEWPFREEEMGPPLAHRLRPERVVERARLAGFGAVERHELRQMELFVLGA
ncbi:MAG: class I SAM-dependent methyltransferase [Deltaproteobacteria bacterium]|nr:class I SAM-dependent methyltransferase [Deltaproteobacteria bacterium]